MNQTDYVFQLTFDVRYRVIFEIEKGKVIKFVVQLECLVGDRWGPVVRYDTAHGLAHRDRYKADGTINRHEMLPVSEYNQALTFAIKDIRSNWGDWLREFRGLGK
jgi:hypothetical protein